MQWIDLHLEIYIVSDTTEFLGAIKSNVFLVPRPFYEVYDEFCSSTDIP
jgi:hypothetical protein